MQGELTCGHSAPHPALVAGPTTRPAQVEAWWKTFNDPMLDSLLNRAVESNLDLRVATARVREARAQRGFIAADLWPQVGMSSSYDYRGSSRNTGPKPQDQPGLSMIGLVSSQTECCGERRCR
jgi:outer membrane protein TolC